MNTAGHWLVINYPKHLQRVALRKCARFPIHVGCSIFDEKRESEISIGFLDDISINGCAFIGSLLKDCELGAKYQLQLKFDAEQTSISVPALVKNIIDTRGTGEIRYGFAFLKDCEERQYFIQQAIFYFLSRR